MIRLFCLCLFCCIFCSQNLTLEWFTKFEIELYEQINLAKREINLTPKHPEDVCYSKLNGLQTAVSNSCKNATEEVNLARFLFLFFSELF